MAIKGASLSVYLTLRRVWGAVFARGQEADRFAELPEISLGSGVLWVHVGDATDGAALSDVLEELLEDRPDLFVLVTKQKGSDTKRLASLLPANARVEIAPPDLPSAANAFIRHYKPDVCLWLDLTLNVSLLEAAKNVELIMADAAVPLPGAGNWLPGVQRAALRYFDKFLVLDTRQDRKLRRLGVADDKREVVGKLQGVTAPLPCSQAERDSLAELFAARPVWLAAGLPLRELGAVLTAHKHANRRSHRLLLVISPQDMADGEKMLAQVEAAGWSAGLRSRDDEPESRVDVYIADLPEELGLWYRLAPVSFLAGSLLGDGPGNPSEAAALGTAMIIGSNSGEYEQSCRRFIEVGAAISVADAAELVEAVERLLAPDQVALMASAAWAEITAGAGALDRVVETVNAALDARGV